MPTTESILSNGNSLTVTHLDPFQDGNHRFHVTISSKSYTGYSYYQTTDSGRAMCYESNAGRQRPFLYLTVPGFRSLRNKSPEDAVRIFTDDLIKILEDSIVHSP